MDAKLEKQIIHNFAKAKIENYCQEKHLVSNKYYCLQPSSSGAKKFEVMLIIESLFDMQPTEDNICIVDFLGSEACQILISNGEQKYFFQFAQKVLNKLASDRKTDNFFKDFDEEITEVDLRAMEEEWN